MPPCTMRVGEFPWEGDVPWVGWARGAACFRCWAGGGGWALRVRVFRVSDQASGRARSAIKVVKSNQSRDCAPLGQLAWKVREGS